MRMDACRYAGSDRSPSTPHEGGPQTWRTDAQRPPVVTRGAKSQGTGTRPPIQATPARVREPGTFGTADWFRCTAPESLAPLALDWLRRRFGEPEDIKGRHYFKEGKQYPGGASLMLGHASGIICLEFNGSTLDTTDEADRRQLVADLCAPGGFARALERDGVPASLITMQAARTVDATTPADVAAALHPLNDAGHRIGAWKCTRIDLAIDFIGQGLRIVDHINASFDAGECCGAKRRRKDEDGDREEWFGRTVYLGLRGENGSGKLVRAYDKGLETGTAPAGHWERYEVEFTGDRAPEVARIMATSGPEWLDKLRGIVLGAVEFRVVTGRRDRSRRPLAEWWARLIDNVRAITVSVPRLRSTLQSFAGWARRCVAPTLLAMRRHAGMSLEDTVSLLCGEDVEEKATTPASVLEQWAAWLKDQESAAAEVVRGWIDQNSTPTLEAV